jgi:hypothetical protein
MQSASSTPVHTFRPLAGIRRAREDETGRSLSLLYSSIPSVMLNGDIRFCAAATEGDKTAMRGKGSLSTLKGLHHVGQI